MSILNPPSLFLTEPNSQRLLGKMRKAFSSKSCREISYKADGTPVTALDYKISEIFENFCHENEIHFLCEENSVRTFQYPLMILDPVDGTREFIDGLPEFAVSCGIYRENNWGGGEAWIFNLATEEQAKSHCLTEINKRETPEFTYVSRSKSAHGLFQDGTRYHKKELGSIAYKLLKLAKGECDFIVSVRAKNIWDIAAGTTLCQKQGICLYGSSGEIKSLEAILFSPPLLWCYPDHYQDLRSIFD